MQLAAAEERKPKPGDRGSWQNRRLNILKAPCYETARNAGDVCFSHLKCIGGVAGK